MTPALPPISRGRSRAFARIQRQWTAFGEAGFDWAVTSVTRPVATDPVAAYLSWGREVWGRVQQRASALGLATTGREALDLGCGPGRIAQALAGSYERVLGLDIAPKMIELARRMNAQAERCEFAEWSAPDLEGLESERFDLVICTYLVQHLPRWLTARYLQELVRTTRPGGTIILQFHGDVSLSVVRLLPSPLLALAYRLGRRLQVRAVRQRGPWDIHLVRPPWVRTLLERSGASVTALDRAPEPEGRMVSYWVFARRTLPTA